MERGRPRKPADAFVVGDRLRYRGRDWTVTAFRHLDGDRNVELTLRPDAGVGDRIIFRSGDHLEVGDEPSFWRRLRKSLRF